MSHISSHINIHDFENWHPGPESDFKGEVLAAELVANGLQPALIASKALGVHRRPVETDIAAINVQVDNDGQSRLVLNLNREGLYDMLPEGLTHFNDARKQDNDKKAILKTISEAKKDEADARIFFEPFENDFFYARVQLELQERALLNLAMPKSARQLYNTLFGNSFTPQLQQMSAMLQMLPLMPEMQGDIDKMQYCLCTVLQQDITINIAQPYHLCTYEGPATLLGNCYLDTDAIAGNGFISQWPLYNITIQNIAKAALPQFFKTGTAYTLLCFLLGYLLPANAAYNIDVHIQQAEEGCCLADDEEVNIWHLGYGTYLAKEDEAKAC